MHRVCMLSLTNCLMPKHNWETHIISRILTRLCIIFVQQLLRLDAPIQRDIQEQAEHTQEPFTKRSSPSTHFIETAPSVLRHVPWIQCVEHKVIIFYRLNSRTCIYIYIYIYMHTYKRMFYQEHIKRRSI